MKVLAINGSYHKDGVNSALIDRALGGLKSVIPETAIEKIFLAEKNIEYCRGCLACRNDDPDRPVARCVIDDDMTEICRKLDEADGYIFATPIYMGTVTAVMKTFCERYCWTLSKPGRWPLKGCPSPRTGRKKAAVVIMSTAVVPVLFRRFCDDATKFFRGNLPCVLNAKIAGSLFAGSVGWDKKDPDRYLGKAEKLGKKLGRKLTALNKRRVRPSVKTTQGGNNERPS